MKKSLLFVATIVLSFTMFSQRAYFQFGTGYAFPISTSALGNFESISGNDTILEQKFGTYGEGIPITARIGVRAKDHVVFELGASYIMSKKLEISNIKNGIEAEELQIEHKSNRFRLQPSMVLTTKHEKVNFFARTGANIPLTRISTREVSFKTINAQNEIEERYEKYAVEQAFTIGFVGSLGFDVKLGPKTYFFAELEGINQSIKTKYSTVVEATVDGKDAIDEYNTSEKEQSHVEVINESASNADTDKASEVLAEKLNHNSLGFLFGISFKF